MKLHESASFSPLVVTEFGTGFLCARTRELRKAFGTHVSPQPREIRQVTTEEARDFFRHRISVRNYLINYYNQADKAGRNTGD